MAAITVIQVRKFRFRMILLMTVDTVIHSQLPRACDRRNIPLGNIGMTYGAFNFTLGRMPPMREVHIACEFSDLLPREVDPTALTGKYFFLVRSHIDHILVALYADGHTRQPGFSIFGGI